MSGCVRWLSQKAAKNQPVFDLYLLYLLALIVGTVVGTLANSARKGAMAGAITGGAPFAALAFSVDDPLAANLAAVGMGTALSLALGGVGAWIGSRVRRAVQRS